MIHLIECCDDASAALYKHVVASETQAVEWVVEWRCDYDADEDAAQGAPEWRKGTARFFSRLSNMLYCEDSADSDKGKKKKKQRLFLFLFFLSPTWNKNTFSIGVVRRESPRARSLGNSLCVCVCVCACVFRKVWSWVSFASVGGERARRARAR